MEAFQNSFLEKFATFTVQSQPPLGSVLRSVPPIDSILSLDMIFALDTSGSVGKQNFDAVKTFVIKMAKAFVMDVDSTHMGAIAFGNNVYEISPLTSSKDHFLFAVNDFQYQDGATNTTGALLEAKNMFRSGTRTEDSLKRVLILFTDGRSNHHPRPPKKIVPELAKLSVERFVFGVGNVNQEELTAIASPPTDAHKFSVQDHSVFREFADAITPSKQSPCYNRLKDSLLIIVLLTQKRLKMTVV